MNILESIRELESVMEKSETFRLDMYDRAHIADVIRFLRKMDESMMALANAVGLW
jgi:hypothetical protein